MNRLNCNDTKGRLGTVTVIKNTYSFYRKTH